MKHRAPRAAAAWFLLLTIAACGEATDVALDPATPSSEPTTAEPSAPPATPTWGGCTKFGSGTFDYFSDVGGEPTRELAAKLDPGHQLVPVQDSDYRHVSWYVVDEDGVIERELTFQESEAGWLVETQTTCAE